MAESEVNSFSRRRGLLSAVHRCSLGSASYSSLICSEAVNCSLVISDNNQEHNNGSRGSSWLVGRLMTVKSIVIDLT